MDPFDVTTTPGPFRAGIAVHQAVEEVAEKAQEIYLAANPPKKKIYVFIDETGDRGMTKLDTNQDGNSPIFGMAAVLVPEEHLPKLNEAIQKLRDDFKVPGPPSAKKRDLSWKKDLKTWERQKHAAQVLAKVSGIKILYYYADKKILASGGGVRYTDTPTDFYHFSALRIYRMILWAIRKEWDNAEAIIRFGHVRHHDHTVTKNILESHNQTQWMHQQCVLSLEWVGAIDHLGSQAADLYGGFLKAAVWPGEFGFTHGEFLLDIWHQIRHVHQCTDDSIEWCAIPNGIFTSPDEGLITAHQWFPCTSCKYKKSPSP